LRYAPQLQSTSGHPPIVHAAAQDFFPRQIPESSDDP
jgi:hypothetical protein